MWGKAHYEFKVRGLQKDQNNLQRELFSWIPFGLPSKKDSSLFHVCASVFFLEYIFVTSEIRLLAIARVRVRKKVTQFYCILYSPVTNL